MVKNELCKRPWLEIFCIIFVFLFLLYFSFYIFLPYLFFSTTPKIPHIQFVHKYRRTTKNHQKYKNENENSLKLGVVEKKL